MPYSLWHHLFDGASSDAYTCMYDFNIYNVYMSDLHECVHEWGIHVHRVDRVGGDAYVYMHIYICMWICTYVYECVHDVYVYEW